MRLTYALAAAVLGAAGIYWRGHVTRALRAAQRLLARFCRWLVTSSKDGARVPPEAVQRHPAGSKRLVAITDEEVARYLRVIEDKEFPGHRAPGPRNGDAR
jgi:hypothetical protein